MVKQFTLYMLFSIGIMNAFAQPVLNGSSYFTNSKNWDLNFQYVDPLSVSAFVAPTVGNNQTYDYTNLTLQPAYAFTIARNSVPTLITDATHELSQSDNISATLALASFNQMYKVDVAGVSLTGWAIGAQTIPLGGADNIKIAQQYAKFSKPIFLQKFPQTVGTLINDNVPTVVEYPFTVNVAAFGLVNAPALRRQYITQKDSIVGWGIFKRKSPTGATLSDTALLSSRIKTTVDSFFLNGSPAPAALVTGLGATQGRTVVSSRLSFLQKNRAIATMYFLYPTANFTGSPIVSIEFGDALRTPTEEAAQIVNVPIKIYPNPVKDGHVTLEIPQNTEGVSIVNAVGQTVFQQKNKGDNLLKVDVSAWASGIYFVHSGNEVVKFIKN